MVRAYFIGGPWDGRMQIMQDDRDLWEAIEPKGDPMRLGDKPFKEMKIEEVEKMCTVRRVTYQKVWDSQYSHRRAFFNGPKVAVYVAEVNL